MQALPIPPHADKTWRFVGIKYAFLFHSIIGYDMKREQLSNCEVQHEYGKYRRL